MATTYISPTGMGNKSGSDWANAASITSLNAMIAKAGPGGEVLLLADAGSYKVSSPINIYGGGAPGAAVTIKGVDHSGNAMEATIEGTRPSVYAASNAAGNELFKLQAGAGNLSFENLQVNNTGTVFRAAGDVSNITIEHVDASNVARFFEDYAGGANKTATVTGLTIRDVEVDGFSKGVIRLQYNSSNILIEDVRGDSLKQDGDNFAIGVHLDGTAHDVKIIRTSMANATDTTSSSYWNGDGFATERGVYNVLFQDTVASGNTDAGYDLKSTGTTLVRAIADDNARNFRIWGEATMIDSVGLDPHKRGGIASQAQVWLNEGAKLTIDGGSFTDSGTNTAVFYNNGTITVSDVSVSLASTAKLVAGKALTGALTTVEKLVPTGPYSLDAGLNVPVVGSLLDTLPIVLAPVVTVPVITVPVIAAPVVSTPVAEAPAASVPVVVAPAAPAVDTPRDSISPLHFVSNAASETIKATSAADSFYFNQASKQGADSIIGFGATDLLMTAKMLNDGNKDGIITYGSNGVLDLGSKMGTVKLEGVNAGLRYLGLVDGHFAYAAASVRPKNAVEGKFGVADTLAGDAGDKKAGAFFFDSALDQSLGHDKVTKFGAKDIIVTTTRIGGSDAGATVAAAGGVFSLGHDGIDLGDFTVTDTAGKSVGALEFDGERVVGDTHYYVYSAIGSAAGLAQLGF